MENHLCECIYDVLRRSDTNTNTLPALNRLRAQIVRLQSSRLQTILNDNSDAGIPDGEQPTIYHILKTKRRRAERTIYRLRDANVQLQTTPSAVAQTLTTFIRDKYATIEADCRSVTTLREYTRCDLHTTYGETLMRHSNPPKYTKP
jgi:hypothetical protein